MKKIFGVLLLPIALAVTLSGCGKYDYFAHVSDERSELFCAETEDYTVVAACCVRETPFLLDGVTATRTKLMEITLTEKEPTGAEYEIYVLEDVPKGGDMSFRSVTGDYFYSRSTENFPSGPLSLRVVKDGTSEDLLATGVKTEKTLSSRQALDCALSAEKERIKQMTRGGKFCGEFHVRLLRRDKNYYYVGIINEQGGILSLLLDSETGQVLARREKE